MQIHTYMKAYIHTYSHVCTRHIYMHALQIHTHTYTHTKTAKSATLIDTNNMDEDPPNSQSHIQSHQSHIQSHQSHQADLHSHTQSLQSQHATAVDASNYHANVSSHASTPLQKSTKLLATTPPKQLFKQFDAGPGQQSPARVLSLKKVVGSPSPDFKYLTEGESPVKILSLKKVTGSPRCVGPLIQDGKTVLSLKKVVCTSPISSPVAEGQSTVRNLKSVLTPPRLTSSSGQHAVKDTGTNESASPARSFKSFVSFASTLSSGQHAGTETETNDAGTHVTSLRSNVFPLPSSQGHSSQRNSVLQSMQPPVSVTGLKTLVSPQCIHMQPRETRNESQSPTSSQGHHKPQSTEATTSDTSAQILSPKQIVSTSSITSPLFGCLQSGKGSCMSPPPKECDRPSSEATEDDPAVRGAKLVVSPGLASSSPCQHMRPKSTNETEGESSVRSLKMITSPSSHSSSLSEIEPTVRRLSLKKIVNCMPAPNTVISAEGESTVRTLSLKKVVGSPSSDSKYLTEGESSVRILSLKKVISSSPCSGPVTLGGSTVRTLKKVVGASPILDPLTEGQHSNVQSFCTVMASQGSPQLGQKDQEGSLQLGQKDQEGSPQLGQKDQEGSPQLGQKDQEGSPQLGQKDQEGSLQFDHHGQNENAHASHSSLFVRRKIGLDDISFSTCDPHQVGAIQSHTDQVGAISSKADTPHQVGAIQSHTDQVGAIQSHTDQVGVIQSNTDTPHQVGAIHSNTDQVGAIQSHTDQVGAIQSNTDTPSEDAQMYIKANELDNHNSDSESDDEAWSRENIISTANVQPDAVDEQVCMCVCMYVCVQVEER